jgi:peroxiredoxin
MEKILIQILSALILCTCQQAAQQQDEIELAGKIKFPEEGLVFLEEYGNKEIEIIDTVEVTASGEFAHNISLEEPGFYRLNFYGKQMVNLILYQEDLQIEVDGNAADGAVVVTGSQDMQYLTEINQIVQDFQKNVASLNQQYVEANSKGDQQEMERIRDQYQEENTKHKDLLKQKINAMGNSMAVFQVVGNFNAEEDYEFLDQLGVLFAENPPDSKHTPSFLTYIDGVRQQAKNNANLQIGKMAPEISLPNPEGETVPLSSLRGKIVLVDFWAQWCRPCRMENPNIVEAYKKYKDKGFVVYGVSLDRSRDKWLQGIEEDGLPWTHVSDLQYWQSEAARTYNINAIPASFLLDKEGKIIARDLRGPALQQKLKEVIG